MAYDKVVDSSKLDAALTATANAIRAKSGGTGKITWNESNGFAGDVNALPEDGGGVDVSGVTAGAADVLIGKKIVTAAGNLEDGTMPNNGAISKTMDGLNTKSVSIPKGYTSGGTVSMTDDIDNIANNQADKIAQIKAALEGKAAGGGGASVETCTVTIKHYPSYDPTYAVKEVCYQTINDNGETELIELSYSEGTIDYSSDSFALNKVVCNSLIFVNASSTNLVLTGAILYNRYYGDCYIKIQSDATLEFQPTG